MKKGRPKGYSPYFDLSYEELGDYVGRKSLVRVSKTWWEKVTGESVTTPTPPPTPTPPKEEDKIEFNLINLNE
jgi:hypothetical protein